MEMSEVKKEIKDYVRDHYKYYGWYPYDVQVGDTLYTYEQYMDIYRSICNNGSYNPVFLFLLLSFPFQFTLLIQNVKTDFT